MARTAFTHSAIEYPSRRNKKAAKQAGKLHLVPRSSKRPSAEIAVENIRLLIQDIIDGRRRDGVRCTLAEIYREVGLSESFGCDLMRGRVKRVGTRIIDRVCFKTQMTAGDLLDEITD